VELFLKINGTQTNARSCVIVIVQVCAKRVTISREKVDGKSILLSLEIVESRVKET